MPCLARDRSTLILFCSFRKPMVPCLRIRTRQGTLSRGLGHTNHCSEIRSWGEHESVSCVFKIWCKFAQTVTYWLLRVRDRMMTVLSSPWKLSIVATRTASRRLALVTAGAPACMQTLRTSKEVQNHITEQSQKSNVGLMHGTRCLEKPYHWPAHSQHSCSPAAPETLLRKSDTWQVPQRMSACIAWPFLE